MKIMRVTSYSNHKNYVSRNDSTKTQQQVSVSAQFQPNLSFGASINQKIGGLFAGIGLVVGTFIAVLNWNAHQPSNQKSKDVDEFLRSIGTKPYTHEYPEIFKPFIWPESGSLGIESILDSLENTETNTMYYPTKETKIDFRPEIGGNRADRSNILAQLFLTKNKENSIWSKIKDSTKNHLDFPTVPHQFDIRITQKTSTEDIPANKLKDAFNRSSTHVDYSDDSTKNMIYIDDGYGKNYRKVAKYTAYINGQVKDLIPQKIIR